MPQLFPHEVSIVKSTIDSLQARLKELALEKEDAQELSYDWHDNAPLDVVEQELGQARGQLASANSLLNGEVVDYPDESAITIALGSLVLGRDKWGEVPFLLVPQREISTSLYLEAWKNDNPDSDIDDFAVVTPASPLGAAALGTEVGGTIRFEIASGTSSITVEHIDQVWLRDSFGPTAQIPNSM